MEDDSILIAISEVTANDTDDIIKIMNFLAAMSIGCKKLELDTLSKLYSDRLNKFVVVLYKLGYRSNKRLKGSKLSGIQTLLSKAFYNLRVF